MAVIITLLLSALFPSTIERAFTLLENRDWAAAAAALDQASMEDPALYELNNFPYLRGRVAENLKDWSVAKTEFLKISADTALRPLAVWHAAMAAVRLQDNADAVSLVAELPKDFPADLKVELARLLPQDSALKVYATMSTREARLERARIQDDKPALWSLVHERKDDDVGLQSAHILLPGMAGTASRRETLEIADTFAAHRQFDYALPLYQEASRDAAVAAESRYQIARIEFLREDYPKALESFGSIAKDFAGTHWEKDAEYQIASCYWRLGDYKSSEEAYSKYIARYGKSEEGAIRNLVDVYRALDENAKAVAWIDKALAGRLPLSSRQVLQFTKAKILYLQKRYAASALLFRQLGHTNIRTAPGATSKDEARFFEALALSKAGNKTAASAIWQSLAADPFSYYGVKAAEKLGRNDGAALTSQRCEAGPDKVLPGVQSDLLSARRSLRTRSGAASASAVSELMFLELWDEASAWNERSPGRPDYRMAAELAYAAGRYHRAIAYADHLPRSEAAAAGLLYPAGFHELICREAAKQNVDPLWLHAIIWQESKYNPFARSGASARGLMQFIPETANAVGAAIGLTEFSLDKLYDPNVNIPMGAHYWASLMKEFNDPVLALAAYNGGPTNVRRWISKSPPAEKDLFVADIGFFETKRYVQAVYGARAAYGSLK